MQKKKNKAETSSAYGQPSTPRAKEVKSAHYAGPDFNRSPAASALPIPEFANKKPQRNLEASSPISNVHAQSGLAGGAQAISLEGSAPPADRSPAQDTEENQLATKSQELLALLGHKQERLNWEPHEASRSTRSKKSLQDDLKNILNVGGT